MSIIRYPQLAHWGAFTAVVEDGKLIRCEPFANDPNPSPLLESITPMVYSDKRIRKPAIRRSWLQQREKSDRTLRGREDFVEVEWDVALDLVAQENRRVRDRYGPYGLFTGSYGWSSAGRLHHARSLVRRFYFSGGGGVDQLGNYSWGSAQFFLPYVIGTFSPLTGRVTSWPSVVEHCELFIAFGGLALKNAQVSSGGSAEHSLKPWLEKLAQKGTPVINISPMRDDCPAFVNAEWIPIRPNTDVALMLALAYEIQRVDGQAPAFLATHCVGYEQLADYIRGVNDGIAKTPEWASEITGIPAPRISQLAQQLIGVRSFMTCSYSVQRAHRGEQPYWMAAVLATMIGQIGLPGGGISYGHHYSSIGVPATNAAAPGAFPRNLDENQKPLFDSTDFKGASSTIPVARWIDAILEPGKTIDANGSKVVYPDIKMMIFSGNNPWNHHQDRNRMKQAFQKLECVVTIDVNWTATCRFSDIVLPACTTYERNDIDVYGAYANRGILAMQKMVEPLFESLSDFEIFTRFAALMGKEKEYTRNMSEMEWIETLYNECKAANAGKYEMPDFATFWKQGYVHFGDGELWTRHADFRNDPEINPLGTPSGLIEIFSRKIEQFGYEDCQGHPIWMEKAERSHGGPGSDKYPMWLQSCHPDKRLHSQMCESKEYRETYTVNGREPIYISPVDAKARGIKDGDIVRVFNDRGQLLAGAVVSDRFPKGVVRIHEGAWYGPVGKDGSVEGGAEIGALCSYGDPNTLTLDIGTSKLAQACSAYTCLVEFEKYQGKVPKVSSFDGPIEVEI